MPGPGRGEVTLGQGLLVGCDLCKQSQLCVATIPWVTVRQCITATTWNITRGDLNFWHYLSLGDNTTCSIAKFTFTFLQLSILSFCVYGAPLQTSQNVYALFILCWISWMRFKYQAAAWPLHLLLAPLSSQESRQVQGNYVVITRITELTGADKWPGESDWG